MRGGGSIVSSLILATLAYAMLEPSSVCAAEPIRVLLVMPHGSGALERQVSRLEDALRTSRGPVARAASLAEADAIVQFTSYRHSVDPQGVPQHWWQGEYRLLVSTQHTAGVRSTAQPFRFVVVAAEDWQMEPAIRLLGATLGRAMGLASYSPDARSF